MEFWWWCLGDWGRFGVFALGLMVVATGFGFFFMWFEGLVYPRWLRKIGEIVGMVVAGIVLLGFSVAILWGLWRTGVCLICPECGL